MKFCLYSLIASVFLIVQSLNAQTVSSCSAYQDWVSTSSYAKGNEVKFKGIVYRANFFTTNESPATNTGVGKSWTNLGTCSAGLPANQSTTTTPSGGTTAQSGSSQTNVAPVALPNSNSSSTPTTQTVPVGIDCYQIGFWDATIAYNGGEYVKYNEILYQAKWWTQNALPPTSSGSTSDKPWQVIGNCTSGGTNSSFFWDTQGNLNTNSSSFIGTIRPMSMRFKSHNNEIMRLHRSTLELGGTLTTLGDDYFIADITGRVSMKGASGWGAAQNNLLMIYSNNQTTSNYIAGFKHYTAFSHAMLGTTEVGIMNTVEYNKTTGITKGKHLLLQNSLEGNLGVGSFATAPDAKLHVNGFAKINAAEGTNKDVIRLYSPVKTSLNRDHYVYVANKTFDAAPTVMFGAIGAYESIQGTTSESPKHLIIQEQYNSGGNLGVGYHNAAPTAKLSVNGTTVLNGTVAIGSSYVPTDFKLAVNGKIIAEEVHVKLRTKWPDYVFSQQYKLLPLSQLSSYIAKNNHLPGVPSAEEVKENGINTGEMNAILLEKIEELTLYILQQNKVMEQQQLDFNKRIESLEKSAKK